MKYSELKPKQQEFVQWLFDAGHQDEDNTMFQRGYLKTVANDNGMAWAPAWLVEERLLWCPRIGRLYPRDGGNCR